jgi:hypothetical protein
MRRIVVLVLLALALVVIVNAKDENRGVCKSLNALYELRTETFYQQYIADLQPIQSPSGAVLTSSSIQLVHGETFDVNKLVANPRETRVILTNMVARDAESVISHTFTDSLSPKELKNTKNPRALIWSLSNVVNVGYDHAKSPRIIHTTAGLTVSALLTPNMGNANFSDIHFLFFDASEGELKSLNDTLGSIAFTYPFEADSEPIYDDNGKIQGHQPNSIEQTAINVLSDDVTPIQYASQDDSIRIRILGAKIITHSSDAAAPSFQIDFVTLITTQGSTKIIRYNALSDGTLVTLTTVFKKVLIPKVISTDVSFVQNGNLGGKLEIDQNGRVFIVSNLNVKQSKAFAVANSVELKWPANDIDNCAVFIEIDPKTGNVLSADNLSLKSTDAAKNSFASGLDIKGTFAIIAGNNENVPRGANPTHALQAFISKIDLSTSPFNVLNVYLDKANDVGSEAVAKSRFVAYTAVFAVNGLSDRTGNMVTVGGSIINYGAPYITDGRLLLIDLQNGVNQTTADELNFEIFASDAPEKLSGTFDILYNLQVGYSKSNVVTIVKRTSLKVPIDSSEYEIREELLLGCVFDAPITAQPKPKDKQLKFRTVHSGLWQADCTPPNVRLFTGFSAFFFTVFGVNTFFFILVIIYSSTLCFLEVKKERDLERRLIMEGVYF